MNHYKSVELYNDEKIKEIMGKNYLLSEMSSFEKQFLCGLLMKKKPKHIMEIGVAEGATTSIICYCLSELELKSKVISIDLLNEMWNGTGKKTGYVALEEQRKGLWTVDWELKTGIIVTDYLDTIKQKIDFLIIDTVHSLPGEILDFLAVAPYLDNDAVVVLHDIGLNHLYSFEAESGKNMNKAFATKLLFDVVKGPKYYMADMSRYEKMPNIGAFIFTKETWENIVDIISCLSITWAYCPEEGIIDRYRCSLVKKYEPIFIELFDRIVKVQVRTVAENKVQSHYSGDTNTLCKKWKSARRVYIYGCGAYGKYYYTFAKCRGLQVYGMVVSDGQQIDEIILKTYKIPIYHLSELKDLEDNDWFVLAVDGKNFQECKRILDEMEWKNIL